MASSLLVLALVWVAAASSPDAKTRLGRGFAALRAGDPEGASHELDGVAQALPAIKSYALYLQAEGEFYRERYSRACPLYDAVARDAHARLAPMAAFRAADCLWMDGRRVQAAARYRKLLAAPTVVGDRAVARFRLAELATGDEAAHLFHALYVDFPGHPLAEVAARRAALEPANAHPIPATGAVSATPAERIRRARALSDAHDWPAALAELDRLPPVLEADLAAERDLVAGMTKYHSRKDYPGAAKLLLGVVDRLNGERAASAAFHGARALSRADNDDLAIVDYLRVVQRFPESRWAPEAQFRAGWLDFNRGRFRTGLPALAATLARFPRSEFATDAAWYVAFSHYLLGEPQAALTGLDEFERRARGPFGKDGIDALGRVAYWRARAWGKQGAADKERSLLRELVERAPFSYYGLLARTRLRTLGSEPELILPAVPATVAPSVLAAAHPDPALLVVDLLSEAGLLVEAGAELERAEPAFIKRVGWERAAGALLSRYPRFQNFRRPYQLAEARAAAALNGAPAQAGRPWWQAAYPRAYESLIERWGPTAGNPDLFLYAIMRKESGFNPHDVSYADARGLLQMIPPTSARVAQSLGLEFHPDELYVPEINIQLGAAYIGALHRKFRDQPLLTAGAFNAGPRALMRWCDLNGQRAPDEFVELVTYEQTREYIKRVAAIYARYLYLYANQVFAPAPNVDCRYDKGGPDF